jgi:uncharacterized sulfatase
MNNKKSLSIALAQWLRLNALLLLCMIAVRPLFFLEVYFRVGLAPIHFFTILSGAIYDLLLVCRIFAYGLIPFLVLHAFFPKTARGIFIGLIVFYAVVSALLAEYYCNLTMPLDHVILMYSYQDLKTTLSSSATLSIGQVIWFLLQVGVPVGIVVWSRKWGVKSGKRREKSGKSSVLRGVLAVLIVAVGLLVPYNRMIREERLYPSHYDFCLAVNQPSYSYIKIADYLRNEVFRDVFEDSDLFDEHLKEAVAAYHAVHPEFEYDYPDYPFYRKATDPDVLSPFLRQTSDGLPPNLVFIIVEGLGRRLTAVWEPVLSFTPFIDSLASEGLFWPQCLSTAERTFAVLPSVFASAPHGRYGFCTTLSQTPRHHSLLRDLERNGYYSSFYYGGELTFDHYDFFLQANHVDYLFSPSIVVEDTAKSRLLTENHRWGLDDDQLVELAIAQKRQDTVTRRPFVDMYLTLSTHEPFVVDDLEHYEELARQRVENTPNVTDQERSNVMKNLNIFACYLYMDECIRNLFAYYASRPDFENTLFVLTGDHRMAYLPFGSSIRKYNVPLVIYSPLLSRSKQMEAVVSHLDITPSLNAYLHANYNYAIDDHCHWLGTSFDTVSEFRNTRKLAFMLNNRDVVDYCSGNHILSSQKLFQLDSRLVETKDDNENLCKLLMNELDNFDLISRFVVKEDLLLPRGDQSNLYSCLLDFDHNSMSVFDKYLVKDSAFLRVGKEVEYFSLCSNLAVLPIYEDLLVEVSFDIRSVDTSLTLPALRVALGDAYAQRNLSEVNGLNTGKWEHYHARIPMEVLHQTETQALKLVLWKKNPSSFELDNLVVNVEASLRQKDQ